MSRAELKIGNFKDDNGFRYSKGRYFAGGNDVYDVEVRECFPSRIEVEAEHKSSGEVYNAETKNQPILYGSGLNRHLGVSTEEAKVPMSDEQLEAYAEFALQYVEKPFLAIEVEAETWLD